MRMVALGLAMLLVGAAPPVADVPLGTFRTWGVHPAASLHLAAGGLRIDVVATPCEPVPQNEGCRYDGISNQATITVARPGLPPFAMTSDRQASFVRVAAMRLARGAAGVGVVVDNQWGGSGGLTEVSVIEPVAGGFRRVRLAPPRGDDQLIGRIADHPADLSGDGRVDFVLEGHGFAGGWTCNACLAHPPLVLTVKDGRSVDISADPAVARIFARDAPQRRRVCLSREPERNGNCAAYVADAARSGRLAAAWRAMLAHYERHPQMGAADEPCAATARTGCASTFPAKLKGFLLAERYVTPAQAAGLPPS